MENWRQFATLNEKSNEDLKKKIQSWIVDEKNGFDFYTSQAPLLKVEDEKEGRYIYLFAEVEVAKNGKIEYSYRLHLGDTEFNNEKGQTSFVDIGPSDAQGRDNFAEVAEALANYEWDIEDLNAKQKKALGNQGTAGLKEELKKFAEKAKRDFKDYDFIGDLINSQGTPNQSTLGQITRDVIFKTRPNVPNVGGLERRQGEEGYGVLDMTKKEPQDTDTPEQQDTDTPEQQDTDTPEQQDTPSGETEKSKGTFEKVRDGGWRGNGEGRAFPNANKEVVDLILKLQQLTGAEPDGVFGNETARKIRNAYRNGLE